MEIVRKKGRRTDSNADIYTYRQSQTDRLTYRHIHTYMHTYTYIIHYAGIQAEK